MYQPSTRPGTPLPHAWIDDEDGRRRPVKDLVAPGRFLLITGEDGQAWCEAAGQLAAEASNPQPDQRGPARYKKHLAAELTIRALTRAAARAQGRG